MLDWPGSNKKRKPMCLVQRHCCGSVLVMLLVAMTKHLTKNNVREKRFILVHGLRAQSTMVGKAGPQEWLLAVSAGSQGSHLADQQANSTESRVRTQTSKFSTVTLFIGLGSIPEDSIISLKQCHTWGPRVKT